MNTSKTILLTAAAVLFSLPTLQGQQPAPEEKVIYTARVYCTVDIEGETTNLCGSATDTSPEVACEKARRKVTESYPNAICGDCVVTPPVSTRTMTRPLSSTTAPTRTLPWKVAYKCRGSDGKPYITLGDGCNFCEAYNLAKSESDIWLSAINVQCCSACYYILREPCTCKPKWKLFRRR